MQCCVVRRHGRPLGAWRSAAPTYDIGTVREDRGSSSGGDTARAVLCGCVCVCGGGGSNSDSPFVVATSGGLSTRAGSLLRHRASGHAAYPRCAVATTPLCEQRVSATRSDQGKFRPASRRGARWRGPSVSRLARESWAQRLAPNRPFRRDLPCPFSRSDSFRVASRLRRCGGAIANSSPRPCFGRRCVRDGNGNGNGNG